MGKLGALGLNASSDIDIVFICDEPDADAMDSLNLLARRVADRSIRRSTASSYSASIPACGPRRRRSMVPSLDFSGQYFVAQGRM